VYLVFRKVESLEELDCVQLKRLGALALAKNLGQALDRLLLDVGEDLEK
jgi:hypothetical protein